MRPFGPIPHNSITIFHNLSIHSFNQSNWSSILQVLRVLGHVGPPKGAHVCARRIEQDAKVLRTEPKKYVLALNFECVLATLSNQVGYSCNLVLTMYGFEIMFLVKSLTPHSPLVLHKPTYECWYSICLGSEELVIVIFQIP